MLFFFFLNPPRVLAILFLNCATKLFRGLDLRSQHLVDKVFSDGHRNIMNQPKVEQFSTEQSNTEEEIAVNKVEIGANLRTKRKICRPHYLKDFVTNGNPKCFLFSIAILLFLFVLLRSCRRNRITNLALFLCLYIWIQNVKESKQYNRKNFSP